MHLTRNIKSLAGAFYHITQYNRILTKRNIISHKNY